MKYFTCQSILYNFNLTELSPKIINTTKLKTK